MDQARVIEMFADVAEQLWRINFEREDAPHLIFPMKRDGSIRVSEQESKILITHWLEEAGVHYSVETPTREMYQQKGAAALSARIDVTCYGSARAADRVLNIELKAHNPDSEAFRKDFEKLLREPEPGAWFHTLSTASEATWRALLGKMLRALEDVAEHADGLPAWICFGFVVLDDPKFVSFLVEFGLGWRERFPQAFEEALGAPARPSWTPDFAVLASRQSSSQSAEKAYSGTQARSFIYAPEIDATTFLHLSTKGDSYALRSFGGKRGIAPFTIPGIKTTSELRERYTIEVELPAPRKNLDTERTVFVERIAELNRGYGLGE